MHSASAGSVAEVGLEEVIRAPSIDGYMEGAFSPDIFRLALLTNLPPSAETPIAPMQFLEELLTDGRPPAPSKQSVCVLGSHGPD
jgi:hypothetical protein